jgi:hypothetical protein
MQREDILKFALENFELSDLEKEEAIVIDQQMRDGCGSLLENFAYKTKNSGAQYLLARDERLLRSVIRNKDLNPVAVLFFLEHLAEQSKAVPMNIVTWVIDTIITSEQIVADVKLFKRVWSVAEVLGHPDISMELFGYSSLLYDAMDARSTARNGEVNAMSVDTLLLILNYMSKFDSYETSPRMRDLRDEIMIARVDELEVWVKINLPDYEGLPLSWIIKILDLHTES